METDLLNTEKSAWSTSSAESLELEKVLINYEIRRSQDSGIYLDLQLK